MKELQCDRRHKVLNISVKDFLQHKCSILISEIWILNTYLYKIRFMTWLTTLTNSMQLNFPLKGINRSTAGWYFYRENCIKACVRSENVSVSSHFQISPCSTLKSPNSFISEAPGQFSHPVFACLLCPLRLSIFPELADASTFFPLPRLLDSLYMNDNKLP